MTATHTDATTSILDALDWDHVVPCEYPEDHGHRRAMWRVTFPCGDAFLACTTCRGNWLSHLATCPRCPTAKFCARCDRCGVLMKHDEAIWGPLT